MHEAQLHEANCFITLTYRDEDLPEDGSLEVRDWQLFAKRLRKALQKGRKKSEPNRTFRYLMCGEYGEKTFRCHFHAAIFQLDFRSDPGAEVVDHNDLGQPLYRSPVLEEAWKKGKTYTGELTYESARYVAQYITKKAASEADYEDVPGQGLVRPPFATMSRRPGLGRAWIEKYYSDVYPHDEVIWDGHATKPPKYYDQVAMLRDPEFMESLKTKRKERAESRPDNSPIRLAQRKEYQELKLQKSRKNHH